MPLYFAYGSNMDRDAMARRCPGSKLVGRARLSGYRFVIMREGYASVTRDPRGAVWGLLWDLALADMPALDRYEGVSGGLYTKAHLPVAAEAGMRRALVYLGRDSAPGLPRPGYLEAVIAAAERAELPSAYLAGLRTFLPRRVSADAGPLQDGEVRRVRPIAVSPLSRSGTGRTR